MLFNLNRNKPGSKPEGEKLHLPLLPLRDVVVFPYMVVPLFVAGTIHQGPRACDEFGKKHFSRSAG